MNYENIIVEKKSDAKVGWIQLNRPKALNALNLDLLAELKRALETFEADANIGCIVITGSKKAFAAGADISLMQNLTYADVINEDFFSQTLEYLRSYRKPLIAAVAGFALGGGCELAMGCDFILASDSAKFGQPEVKLGTMPGAGGTQRLTLAIGKAKAMELCLTGRTFTSEEAEKAGLVARIIADDDLLDEALKTATQIANYSLPVTMLIKEAINQAQANNLASGLLFERRNFHASFALADRKEGMSAFLEKRQPIFKNK